MAKCNAYDRSLKFKLMLAELSNNIEQHEFEAMKFICGDIIQRRRMEEITNSLQLWEALQERDVLLPTQVQLLKGLVRGLRPHLMHIIESYERDAVRREVHTVGYQHVILPDEIALLASRLGNKWRLFARLIGLRDADVDYVADNAKEDASKRMEMVIGLWKARQGIGTCRDQLLNALRKLEMNKLAAEFNELGRRFHPAFADPAKVCVVGGWESIMDKQNRIMLTVNQTTRIEFDTSLAGDGGGRLTAEFRGSRCIHPFTMESNGDRHTLCITPPVEGEYHISLFWGELILPRCPLTGVARIGYSSLPQQPHPAIEKVVLTGGGLSNAILHDEAYFFIDGTDAGPGIPGIKLTGVKGDIDVSVVEICTRQYRCTYVPHVLDSCLLDIMWSDRRVKGSPFKVNVDTPGDATKVVCRGDGLRMGVTGTDIRSTIDATDAGPD